jgi:hypothetical protein
MDYILIDKNNILEIRKEVDLAIAKNKKVVVVAKEDELNRKVLESNKTGYLLFRDFNNYLNKLKQRGSGLNQVLCRIATQNEVIIGFDFNMLKNDNKLNKSEIISILTQNVKLCRKSRTKIVFFNISQIDRNLFRAFLLSIGMNTKSVKYCIDNSFE